VEDPAWMIGQSLQHLRVFVGGVVVEDGMEILPAGTGRSTALRKAMNSACVCLSWRPPDSFIAYLAGSESLRLVRGRSYNAREKEDDRQHAI
jgi:hypothetical protein